ncbi:apoptosis-inducing factor (AIF)-like mitochondrion-associated inducer of death 1 [Sporothrix schenckii 1099-18]|uniref:FAD/NAD(P)-binding domain-containing protein n=2 Tax=Sporothrix schenckii TaxID=29908 RepID=U7Q8F5_SPOS1|nr:apoptosis-inducing factor (AIF)-like mitochondrion-associated inducer of death 1 [Sporothrix schenckii 1099-18]ERT03036.1 hypothetical protein HMPREF1624_01340 [Sporothrix schenckii ATCC 58251]KJR84571.1 apoptosis-inducing factor (AIF)-like mitochondrion-associated inducer of death 1 [Sporothrix schenckii 1099-18]
MGSALHTNDASAPFKILVVGGSYGGLAAALNLSDLCLGKAAHAAAGYVGQDAFPEETEPIHAEITIVDERDGFYHLIGSPLVFANKVYADKAWVLYKDILALQTSPNIKTIHGSVTSVEMASKTATIAAAAAAGGATSTVSFDFIIVAAGLRRAFPVVPQSPDKASYLAEVNPHIEAVSTAQDGVLVVGGGAVGIEMAAELKLAQPHVKVTLAHSRSRLLSSEPLPDNLAEKTLDILKENGVGVVLEHRLQETRELDGGVKEVVFTNGHTLRVNAVVFAISKSQPSTSFLPAAALNEEGYIKIQPNLFFPPEVPNYDCALAGGDIVKWSGIKRCGGAMHMGYYMARNAHERMRELVFGAPPQYQTLKPVPAMIAIALGHNALAFQTGGELQFGKDVADRYFAEDVGFEICWKIMGLGARSGVNV